MNRREFVKTGAIASMGAGLEAQAKPPAKKPNVLYVFDDQHRAVSLPGEPFAAVNAPNLDKFRRANMSMDMCISNFPLCCPYRAVLMSGKYSAANGVMNNDIALKYSEFTLTRAFKKEGYHVGYVGKWHLAGNHDGGFKFIPKGPGRFEVDDWHAWENTNAHYECFTFDPETGQRIGAKNWAPIDMTDQAIGLLQNYAASPESKPWLLMLSYNPPHPPFDPPQADRNQNPVAAQKYRPNVKIEAGSSTPWLRNTESFHKAMQGYIGGISGIDEQFGRLMKALDDTGMAKDTIVIFTSDHGEMMGSQGRKGKVVPWNESNHVPFMVRYPGVTPRGGSSTNLFAAIDIYPSVCGMAGVPVPDHCQGHDLSGLWRGEKVAKAPDVVFLQNGGFSESAAHASTGGPKQRKKAAAAGGEEAEGDEESGTAHPYRGLRTSQWTYAVAPTARWLLYDNLADPYQMTNLANDAAHKPLMEGFDAQIKAWLAQTGDKFQYPKTS